MSVQAGKFRTVGDILGDMDKDKLMAQERGIGDNNPPEPTPFEAARDAIQTLRMEAGNWLDGTAIETQDQANEVGRLREGFRKAWRDADAARKVENEPFDKGKAEVQGRYNPILKIAKDSEDMAARALAKFMALQDAERQRQAQEAARIAQEQAEAARQAIAAANASDDIAAREDAEQLVAEAEETAKLARTIDRDKVKVETGGLRRMTLRSVWSATITDRLEAMRSLWRLDPTAFDDLLLKLANDRAKAGIRELAGIAFHEEHVAR